MDTFFYTTGQVAGELKVSSQTIRNLCASGQIKAERSAGGHFRIAPAELERLKGLESLPAVARATIDNGVRQSKRNPSELLAAPSVPVIESAEEAFVSDRKLSTDMNQLQRLKVRKESQEILDYFQDREQRRIAREIEEDRRECELAEKERREHQAELTAEEQERFTLNWISHALTTSIQRWILSAWREPTTMISRMPGRQLRPR